ncbi:MAG: acylphosphatase [Bacteroidota bacterium]
MKRYRMIVKGKVQGVGYRQFTKEQATQLTLSGWVRNEPNGEVCLEVQGPVSHLDQLVALCKQGPSWSRVDHVDWEEVKVVVGETFFTIKYV